eukprot:scaffold23490_cov84-Isochrysis_galbana.AAC.1
MSVSSGAHSEHASASGTEMSRKSSHCSKSRDRPYPKRGGRRCSPPRGSRGRHCQCPGTCGLCTFKRHSGGREVTTERAAHASWKRLGLKKAVPLVGGEEGQGRHPWACFGLGGLERRVQGHSGYGMRPGDFRLGVHLIDAQL